ncbi:hypothetical protein AMJ80_08695 [bacterium SM23_31]|nr:MAG: hypothetical protein AMJ80_08695 [bacterium SM23_31]
MVVEQSTKIQCLKLVINGIVQGVGFRPFIYRIAKENNLKGYVLNNSHGVEIIVEGEREHIDAFLYEIQHNAPPLAHITHIHFVEGKSASGGKESPPKNGFTDFTILDSKENGETATLIAPDIAVCDDCLKELFDPYDRRYLYPFINCTNCGPRYTIIDDIPYDRIHTSMKHFIMCPECQREYDDPLDRRFHAQPNACPKCGPKVELLDNSGNKVGGENHGYAHYSAPIVRAIEFLKMGKIVAVKGLGGFHLACDAENDEAVQTLRKRKQREEKPLAVMAKDIRTIKTFAFIEPEEERLLSLIQRPVALLREKMHNTLSENVAPHNNYFGVLLPYTPIHYILLNNTFKALVMTSGNISEEPIATGNREALERLSTIADYFLLHDRDIYIRNDDSVYRVFEKKPYPIRRSRGFVPVPVFLSKEIPPVFGCGAELKNTICLTRGNKAFLSQHIGDMENYETLKSFDLTYNRLKNILEIEPEIVAYDLHPDYLSTAYALELTGKKLVGVQHHHAHIVSCMAENPAVSDEEVIGISLDGTGYGLDGRIWGGEVLIATLRSFERAAHFEYVPMPGGEKVIKEPWRMGLSYLYHAFGENLFDANVNFLHDIETNKKDIILKLIDTKLNAPLTSSCGRLFDGVAALIGLRETVRYEGQAAVELENTIPVGWKFFDNPGERYTFSLYQQKETKIIRLTELIKNIVHDIERKEKKEVISCKFHNTLIEIFKEICIQLRAERKINTVVLSGGCFQNMYLLSHLKSLLEKYNFTVYSHAQVPTNDGGIALGQAVAAGLT